MQPKIAISSSAFAAGNVLALAASVFVIVRASPAAQWQFLAPTVAVSALAIAAAGFLLAGALVRHRAGLHALPFWAIGPFLSGNLASHLVGAGATLHSHLMWLALGGALGALAFKSGAGKQQVED